MKLAFSRQICEKHSNIKLHEHPTAHKERKQLGDRRNDGESNCNSGDGTGQMAQPMMMMMMMMTTTSILPAEAELFHAGTDKHTKQMS
jgi:hypothetical protein